jgi:hypothetical protein
VTGRHFTTETGALRAWVSIIVNALAVGLLAGFTITYVAQQQRKICGMIVLLDDRQQKLPEPSDPDAARFRHELHDYRKNLGC